MRTVAIVLLLLTGVARAEQNPVTGRPVPTQPKALTPLFQPQQSGRIVISPKPGSPVIYIDGVRRKYTRMNVKLTPRRKAVDCRRRGGSTTCRITY